MSRPLFGVPPYHFWPPLPGLNGPTDEPPLLARLLEDLLDTAGTTVIPSLSDTRHPPSVADSFNAVRQAAKCYDLAPGIGLGDYLWTHPDALYRGHMASSLRKVAYRINDAHGFLLLLTTDIAGPLLLAPGQRPVRVPSGIRKTSAIEGPFLALVACALAPNGSAEPVGAFAAPIYHSERFLPVNATLDRDVLRLIEHLQVVLDAYGVTCAIRRLPSQCEGPTRFSLEINEHKASRVQLFLTIDAGHDGRLEQPVDRSHFVVTHQNWRSGRLVMWLEQALASKTRSEPIQGA